MINIKNLKKNYNNVEVLKGIDLHIQRGNVFGIIGRSGAGKSTLLRCLNGLEKYDSGLLEIDGIDVFANAPLLISMILSGIIISFCILIQKVNVLLLISVSPFPNFIEMIDVL